MVVSHRRWGEPAVSCLDLECCSATDKRNTWGKTRDWTRINLNIKLRSGAHLNLRRGHRLGGLDPVVVELVRHQRLGQLPQVRLQSTWREQMRYMHIYSYAIHCTDNAYIMRLCLHELMLNSVVGCRFELNLCMTGRRGSDCERERV